MTTLSIVVPVYNEEECIVETVRRLLAVRTAFVTEGVTTDFVFVDDGSRDRSVEILIGLAQQNSCIRLVKLSRNYGHQLAITAGIDMADGDYVCVIDADLQDPPEKIIDMMHLAQRERAEVVYAQRRQRHGDSLFKRVTAAGFYRTLRWLCSVDIPADTGDFRLMTRKVVLALRGLRENNRFIRGLIPWMGFKAVPFLYDREARFAGKTKYPFRKMVRLALNAVLSFSNKPLRVASYAGAGMVLVSLLGLLFMIGIKLFTDLAVPGVTVVLTASILLNGFVILMLGIIGEYIGRIFEEVKQRPLYYVDYTVNLQPHDTHMAKPTTPHG